MTCLRLRIRTPSRLHFGLFGWGPAALRQFGGVGLMVDEPGLELVAEPAPHATATGPLADRARTIALEVSNRLRADGHDVPPVRLTILNAPAAHVGLGVGTQLSLAVARVVTELAGIANVPVETLARLTGRGRRSGIGIHGFADGGLIVDGGRRTETDVPVRLIRAAFPSSWSILMIVPDRRPGLHGPDEMQAFRELAPLPASRTDRLCSLVLLGLVAGVLEQDLPSFGLALTEIQEIVGAGFAPIQGGAFADPETERRVQHLRSLGLHGVGQSSWGPTLYAFSDLGPEARAHFRSTISRAWCLSPERVFWTRAAAAGATLTRE